MLYLALILIPITGAAIISFLSEEQKSLIRTVSLIAVLISLGIVLYILYLFLDGNPPVLFLSWILPLGSYLYFKVGGLSALLLLLSAVLALISTVGSFSLKIKNEKLYYALLLILFSALFGVFTARDFLLFYIFWEAVLIPMYFLIGIFGSENREYAAKKFFIYTFAGSILMLVGFLLVASVSPSFKFEDLISSAIKLSYYEKLIAYLLIFIGFAVKLPSFPFHTWLPDAHVQAPTQASVLLAGVLLKMGGYGLFELLGPMFPGLTDVFSPILLTVAVISIIYGALAAYAQEDMKKLVAYSSVAHMGFVMAAFSAFLIKGSKPAAGFVMWAHGLITGMLFFLVGLAYERYHSRDLNLVRHLTVTYPQIGWSLVFASLASLGLPGLAGFVGEFMVLAVNYLKHNFLSSLVLAGVFLNATYSLKLIARSAISPVKPEEERPDFKGELLPVEKLTVWLFVLLIVISGIVPKIIINIVGKA